MTEGRDWDRMEVKGAQIERTEDGAVNDLSVDLFFMKQPELLPLYLEIERAVRDRLGDFEVVVQKSQITWKGPGSFAALWLPRWAGLLGSTDFTAVMLMDAHLPYGVYRRAFESFYNRLPGIARFSALSPPPAPGKFLGQIEPAH